VWLASVRIYRQPAEPGGAMAGPDRTAIGPSRRRFRRGQGRRHEASIRVEFIWAVLYGGEEEGFEILVLVRSLSVGWLAVLG
jgi:hypothetical protein